MERVLSVARVVVALVAAIVVAGVASEARGVAASATGAAPLTVPASLFAASAASSAITSAPMGAMAASPDLQAARHPACAEMRVDGALHEMTLTAEPVRWEIQPGLVVDGWGYNGSIPGPTVCVTEGDLVRIHLVNHLPVPTTIHWHGIDVPLGMDGVPGLSQDPVEPGDDFTYEFIATNPGTRWYHSHVDTNLQIQLGLFGAFIIEPKTPEPVHYDRDFTVILSEKALDVTPAVAMGEADIKNRDAGNGRGGAFQFDLFLFNGKAGNAIDPLTIAPGERIRVRLINAGNLEHAIHLHGHSFKIIATDGNPVPPAAQLTKDTVLIGSSERYDLEVEGTNPGVWMFHCHINNHAANGMVTVMQYDGAQPLAGGDHSAAHGSPASLGGEGTARPATPTPTAASGHEDHTAAPSATPTPTPTPSGAASPATSPAVAAAGGNAVELQMVDDRFSPTRLTVKAGTTVTWVNKGNDRHTTTSYTGLWDSGQLAHDETFSYTFTDPGSYRFICRQHFLQGMQGTITVEGP